MILKEMNFTNFLLTDFWKNNNKSNSCLKMMNFISKFSIFSLVSKNIIFVLSPFSSII